MPPPLFSTTVVLVKHLLGCAWHGCREAPRDTPRGRYCLSMRSHGVSRGASRQRHDSRHPFIGACSSSSSESCEKGDDWKNEKEHIEGKAKNELEKAQ